MVKLWLVVQAFLRFSRGGLVNVWEHSRPNVSRSSNKLFYDQLYFKRLKVFLKSHKDQDSHLIKRFTVSLGALCSLIN